MTTTTTTNPDGTTTVVFSDLDFGATVAFTSTTTYSAPVNGSAIGTGTFTAVDGTTGNLTSVTTRTGQADANSINFTSAAGALTRQLRLEERGWTRRYSQGGRRGCPRHPDEHDDVAL